MTSRITYWASGGLVVTGAIIAAASDPLSSIQTLAQHTFFLGLVGAFFTLLRDASMQEHQQMMQNADHAFGVATSHMANVAFDRYAEFCDEYLNAVHEIAGELFREGASNKTWKAAGRLLMIQQKHAAWIDSDTRKNLGAFEQQLRSLGANADYLRNTEKEPSAERSNAIKKGHELYKQILNIERSSEPVKEEEVPVAIDDAIEKVRQLLGTESLTTLRRKLIKAANAR